jgi:hypothetical protein
VKPTSWPALFASLLLLALWVDAGEGPNDRVILLTNNSFWRCRMSTGTELARLKSGELVPVHPNHYRERRTRVVDGKKERYVVLRRHDKSRAEPLPPAGWTTAGFDDSRWPRLRGPFCMGGYYKGQRARYRSVPLLCLRGEFRVDDPARAGGLKLSVSFRGGLVVYVNGRELVRSHLPKGDLAPLAPAADYPDEIYADDKGLLLDRKFPDKRFPDRYRRRQRAITDVAVPADRLRKGVNVVALELHRAPAPAFFFTAESRRQKRVFTNPNHVKQFAWWSRIGLESVELSAPAGGAVEPNTGHVGRSKGFHVWNHRIVERVDRASWANPFQPLQLIQLCVPRNGSVSAQVVVGCDQVIRGLRGQCSALTGPGEAVIPASAVEVRYPLADGIRRRGPAYFEGLEEHPPETAPVVEGTGGAVQPVWLTVHVPTDAAPGRYRGTLAVTAKGHNPVRVPVELSVVGWTLPDSKDFFPNLGFWQSPQTVAMQYNVPMWSERHWALLDRTFDLLGQVSTKVLNVTAIRRTHAGNEHGMIRFVKGPDGTLEPDFTVAEKYLALAVKHLGRVPVVCLYGWETFDSSGKRHFGHYNRKDRKILVSVLDRSTGKLTEAEGPAWGTPECRRFWRRVIDGMKQLTRRHGLEKSLMLGIAGDFEPTQTALDDLRGASGGLKWVFNSHVVRHAIGPDKKDPTGYIASAWGGHTRHLDPDFGRGYGWKNPFPRTMTRHFPRYPLSQRLGVEALVTSRIMPRRKGDRPDYGLHGIGRVGADFWPVVKPGRGSARPLAGRYPETEWGQLGLRHSLLALLAPGRDGPIATVSLEMLRENLQEIEARIAIEKALLDPARRDGLGADLAERVQAVLDRRVRAANLAYARRDRRAALSLDADRLSAELYEAVAEVARALAK